MDPVSHALGGRFLIGAASRGAMRAKGCAAAAVLGALSPDIDFVLMPVGWDVYLRAHEIGTHSAAGLAATGAASAVLVKIFARTTRAGALIAAGVAGAATHVAADVASGGRVRLLWPLTDHVTSVPLVAMADPWPIAILAGGILAFWRLRGRRHLVARAVLATLALFLAMKGALLATALRAFDAAAAASNDRIVEARWASLTEWHVFDRSATKLRQWLVRSGGGPPSLTLSWPVDADTPLVVASRRLDTVRNFLRVHALAFAVEEPAGDRRSVLWSDVRFCQPREPVPPRGAPGIACALWFGGTFAPDGRALTQEVRVGTWVQQRPPPRGASP